MKKVRTPEPEDVLARVIGGELAAKVVRTRQGRGTVKPFSNYRAKLTLAVFERASDPKLSAWEYINRDANRARLTSEYLRACVSYDEGTGIFRARLPSCARREGDILGTLGSHGYLTISIAGKRYLSHRLAWLYVYDEWPEQIDHIDRDRTNNAIKNLRSCTNKQNNWNKKFATPASGHVGVAWYAERRKWRARISNRTLGYFNSLEEAIAARTQAVVEQRGEFLGAGV